MASGDGHHNSTLADENDSAICDDDKRGKNVTPKKATPGKGKARTSTPRRRGGQDTPTGGGARDLQTPTRSTRASTRAAVTTVGGIPYSNLSNKHTSVTETYTSLPATAFTTLKLPGSRRFKALLELLNADLEQHALPFPQLILPWLTELAQDQYPSGVQHNSPADSGIDVLTPAPHPGLISNADLQSASHASDMAPVRGISQAERDRLRERNLQVQVVSSSLKEVIQNYYELQVQVQGYESETATRDVLVNKVQDISQSLETLAREASKDTIENILVPPEVVDYVDDGRNPDIYKRELVEVVQRGNAVLNGKMNAFASFSKIFAADLRKLSPEMAKAVNEIMGEEGDEIQEDDVMDEARQQGNGDRNHA